MTLGALGLIIITIIALVNGFKISRIFNDLLKDDTSQINTSSFESQFAEKCISNGDSHFKNKNYAGALMAYEMAYEKETSEKVIRKIAEAHEKLGNSEEAKAFLRKLD